METDGDSQTKKLKRKRKESVIFQRYFFSVMFILQPIWVRCRTIYINKNNGKYLERQFRFVLYCGSVFWLLYFLF